MNFVEFRFVEFILVVYALWLLCRNNVRLCQSLLLFASLVFYSFHEWELVFLILAYCVVGWGIGCWLPHSKQPRLVLALGVGLNLLGLAYWKYTPLILRSIAWMALKLDLGTVAPLDHWFLPIGISFYAFTGIAYMVDVYRGDTPGEKNFWRFALYITFFPQLVAGPILRAHEFLNKIQSDTMPARCEAPLEALTLIARGFFKKMVIADRIALAIDPYFAHVADAATAGVWSLPFVYLYALQIYFDFSGYTDIARGLGLMFGFRWPENFNLPYLAASVQEFWQRWHITLSRFLRDYLYIPLGGNRYGWLLTTRNLMITMLLGGLWHGASWTFLIWGGLHGLYLVVHRLWTSCPLSGWLKENNGLIRTLWHWAAIFITFHAVCLAWCFFRLTVLGSSFACVRKWFVFDADKIFVGGSADLSLWLLLAIYGLAVLSVRTMGKISVPALATERIYSGATARGFLWGSALGILLLSFVLAPGGQQAAFIYFQF